MKGNEFYLREVNYYPLEAVFWQRLQRAEARARLAVRT